MDLLQFTKRGIYCPQGEFYIDPWLPVDQAIITHAHADHARWGMKKYLCHHFTKPLLYSRISKDITCESMAYGESKTIKGVKVSLHPAGHIVGSAQVRLEYKGRIAVASGDYKTSPDDISTPFELVKCHDYVTESTFGLPIYQWKTNDDLKNELQNWVLQNQADGKTSVFIGYSLGKAQRIMKSIEGSAKLFVHSAIDRLNRCMIESGLDIPDYEVLHKVENKKDMAGQIVVVPPALLGSNLLKKIPNTAIAICSGWMHIRGNRRWRAVDAGFVMSDHADWNELVNVVKSTEAERVYVTHGSTEIFSRYLNEQGIYAEPVKTNFGIEEEEKEEAKVVTTEKGESDNKG